MEWLFLSILVIATLIYYAIDRYFEYKEIKELKKLDEEDKQC